MSNKFPFPSATFSAHLLPLGSPQGGSWVPSAAAWLQSCQVFWPHLDQPSSHLHQVRLHWRLSLPLLEYNNEKPGLWWDFGKYGEGPSLDCLHTTSNGSQSHWNRPDKGTMEDDLQLDEDTKAGSFLRLRVPRVGKWGYGRGCLGRSTLCLWGTWAAGWTRCCCNLITFMISGQPILREKPWTVWRPYWWDKPKTKVFFLPQFLPSRFPNFGCWGERVCSSPPKPTHPCLEANVNMWTW